MQFSHWVLGARFCGFGLLVPLVALGATARLSRACCSKRHAGAFMEVEPGQVERGAQQTLSAQEQLDPFTPTFTLTLEYTSLTASSWAR